MRKQQLHALAAMLGSVDSPMGLALVSHIGGVPQTWCKSCLTTRACVTLTRHIASLSLYLAQNSQQAALWNWKENVAQPTVGAPGAMFPHHSGSASHLASKTDSLWPCIYLELCSPQGQEVVLPVPGMCPPMTS